VIIIIKMFLIQVHLQLHDYFGQHLQHVIIIETTFWHSVHFEMEVFKVYVRNDKDNGKGSEGFERGLDKYL
jgi:hypothetical protein